MQRAKNYFDELIVFISKIFDFVFTSSNEMFLNNYDVSTFKYFHSCIY